MMKTCLKYENYFFLYFGKPMENFSWLEKGSLNFKQALIHTAKLPNVREGFCYYTVIYITSIIS